MKQPIYKSKQESLLMQSLAESGLISLEQLKDIKLLYNKSVPYHNFLHALNVAHRVLFLSGNDYSIEEIQSLFIAALFHDAGHSGTVTDLDEFRSLDLAFSGVSKFENKYNYEGINYSILRKAIVGTVFKNRETNTNKYAILMADLDISIIGKSFPEFLYYADFPFSIECGVEIQDWIQDVNYFKFLTNIDKNIFRNPSMQEYFPEYFSNIKKYLKLDPINIVPIYKFWRDNDVTYAEFEEYFYKNTK